MEEPDRKRTYWDVQNEIIHTMAAAGYVLHPRTRLKIFKLFNALSKVGGSEETVAVSVRLRFLLTELVDMRKDGQEPEHNGEFYT